MRVDIQAYIWYLHGWGKAGVTVDRDKIEFSLFHFSSIFNKTLRAEPFLRRGKIQSMAPRIYFHSTSLPSRQVSWSEVEGHLSPASGCLYSNCSLFSSAGAHYELIWRLAIASCQKRPSFSISREETCRIFRRSAAWLAAPRHQRLGGRQRYIMWRTKHRKDTVRDHVVQTCLYWNRHATNSPRPRSSLKRTRTSSNKILLQNIFYTRNSVLELDHVTNETIFLIETAASGWGSHSPPCTIVRFLQRIQTGEYDWAT